MQKRFIRMIAVVLTLLICFTAGSLSAFAAEGANKTSVIVEPVTAKPSDTVQVNINISNNPGIAGATLNVEFADGLTLVSAENGAAFSNLVLTKPGSFSNHCRFLWDSVDGEAAEDGIILKLTFEVASDAAGDLPVCISCNDGDVYNENLDTVEVQTVNGVVKTSSQSIDNPEDNEPAFEVKSVTKTETSSIVNVDILVKNNPGIAGATISVDYVSGLTLLSASNGEAFSELSLTAPGQFTSPCKFLWDSVSGQSVSNGTILTLTFEVDEAATGDLAVGISCDDGDVYNENLDTVKIKTVNGVVKTSSQTEEPPVSDYPTFEVQSVVKSDTSSTVSVDVLVKNNPGIAGATLIVSYAEGLTLVSAENGAAFSELAFTTPGQFANPSRFLWDSISGQSVSNGTILTLTFEIASGATGELNVEISCNDGDVYNEDLDTVNMRTKNGTVLVSGDHYLFAKKGTLTNIDYNNGLISGLQSGINSLENYVFTIDGCKIEYNNTIGTGCLVYVKRNNITIETYSIIIYGDVDGDGWYDGRDSFIVNCLVNGYLTREQIGEEKYLAADCNHDGEINSTDAALLEQAGLILANVDQTASQEELMESDAYMEYLSLLDQSPAQEDIDEPIDNQPYQKNFFEKIVEFVKMVIDFVNSIVTQIINLSAF